LTWPILLMTGWPNLIAYWGGKPPLKNLNIIERWFHLDRWTEPQAPHVDEGEHYSEESPLLGERDSRKKKSSVVDVWSTKEEYDATLEYRVKDTVPRWQFEGARFLAWFVVFQVSFFVTLVIPLVLLRMATGKNSVYVP
jgi:hypothetical protein